MLNASEYRNYIFCDIWIFEKLFLCYWSCNMEHLIRVYVFSYLGVSFSLNLIRDVRLTIIYSVYDFLALVKVDVSRSTSFYPEELISPTSPPFTITTVSKSTSIIVKWMILSFVTSFWSMSIYHKIDFGDSFLHFNLFFNLDPILCIQFKKERDGIIFSHRYITYNYFSCWSNRTIGRDRLATCCFILTVNRVL